MDKYIEIIKRMVSDGQVAQDVAEKYFPELKESEDERIRKELLEHCKKQIDIFNNPKTGNEYAKIQSWVYWLEKQGEWKSIQNVPTREIILAIWELGNKWKELTYGRGGTEHGTQLNYIQKHWQESNYYLQEKQSEQNNIINISEEEKIKIQQDNLDSHKELLEKQGEWKPQGKSALEAIKEEKVDNSNYIKPTGKIEPKFKVGDWVVCGQYGAPCQVESIKDGRYYFTIGIGIPVESVNIDYHLWTIKDAKEGDVLAYRGEQWIFIFENMVDDTIFKYHALISEKGFMIKNKVYTVLPSCITPATKEQCNLLFSKMREAGYEWDDNKKELKKIEQKPKDKIPLEFKKGDILYEQDTMSILLVYERNGCWLMTVCDYWIQKDLFHVEFPYENYGFVQEMSLIPATKEQRDLLFQKMKEAGYMWDAEKKELRKIEQKPAKWSEEDEKIYQSCIRGMQTYEGNDTKCSNWLKFLKDRYTWKPSEEQLKALDIAIKCGIQLGTWEEEALKDLKEQLKKLRYGG